MNRKTLLVVLFFAGILVAIFFVTGRPVNGTVFETPINGNQTGETTVIINGQASQPELFCSTLFTLNEHVLYSHTDGTTTFLRSEPNRDSNVVARIAEGTPAQIIGAPVCAGDYTWWYVSVNGQVGWTAESTNELGYLLESAN